MLLLSLYPSFHRLYTFSVHPGSISPPLNHQADDLNTFHKYTMCNYLLNSLWLESDLQVICPPKLAVNSYNLFCHGVCILFYFFIYIGSTFLLKCCGPQQCLLALLVITRHAVSSELALCCYSVRSFHPSFTYAMLCCAV